MTKECFSMNINQKYNFKIKYEQFGLEVHEHYFDESELKLILQFEEKIVHLKQLKNKPYSMIELGANQAYYSTLFSAILGNENCINIMVEPQDQIIRGIENFKLNNYEGIFIKKAIANNFEMRNRVDKVDFDVGIITFDEILKLASIDSCDVLHFDIYGHEHKLINDEAYFLSKNKFKYIFLCTHSTDTHRYCKEKLKSYGYSLLYEIDPSSPNYNPHVHGIGSDSLLIFSTVQ